jgi:hypothetical protein
LPVLFKAVIFEIESLSFIFFIFQCFASSFEDGFPFVRMPGLLFGNFNPKLDFYEKVLYSQLLVP